MQRDARFRCGRLIAVFMAAWIALPFAWGQTAPTSRPADKSTSRPTSQPAAASRSATSKPANGSSDEEARREGKRILRDMLATYKNCKTYQDSGEAVTVYIYTRKPGGHTDRITFKTAFARPDRFRFEYRDPENDPGQFIIWASKKKVLSWGFVESDVEDVQNLGLAISGAAGVSSGTAHNVPSLLMPDEVGGNSFAFLQDVRWIDQEKLKSGLCNILTAKHAGGPVKIWIDVEKKVIRKIFETRGFNDFRTEQTTTYSPRIDEAVADNDLAFNPPKDK